jgi:Trm5-related predicted tRNA methylase
LGEDLWAELLAVVEGEICEEPTTFQESADEQLQDRQGEITETETHETDVRHYRPLEVPDILIESRQGRHWPMVWVEDRLWGDLSRDERRRLNRLLRR